MTEADVSLRTTLAARIRSARDLREKAPKGPWTFTGDVESVAITIASDPYADIRGEVPYEAYQSWARTGNFIAAAGSLPWDELAAAVEFGAAWERAERAAGPDTPLALHALALPGWAEAVAGDISVSAESAAAALTALAEKLETGR